MKWKSKIKKPNLEGCKYRNLEGEKLEEFSKLEHHVFVFDCEKVRIATEGLLILDKRINLDTDTIVSKPSLTWHKSEGFEGKGRIERQI